MQVVRCKDHGLETNYSCTWCARKICTHCIQEANGYKLCTSCASKLAREKPLIKREETGSRLHNVDESLSKESIDEAKKLLLQRQKKEPKIRNVPNSPTISNDWPQLKD
jgi:hypothetical protein